MAFPATVRISCADARFLLMQRKTPLQAERGEALFHRYDIEEFPPLLVELVVFGHAFLHMYDGFFLSGLAEGVAADFYWRGTDAENVADVGAVFESFAANLNQRDGEGDGGHARATLKG